MYHYFTGGIVLESELSLPIAEADDNLLAHERLIIKEIEKINHDNTTFIFKDFEKQIYRDRHSRVYYSYVNGVRFLMDYKNDQILFSRPNYIEDDTIRNVIVNEIIKLAFAVKDYPLLHASAVSSESSCVGFLATTYSGKSTIAAHLVQCGYNFVSDEILPLYHKDYKQIFTYASNMGIKLRTATLEHFNKNDEHIFNGLTHESRDFFKGFKISTQPLTLKALFLIRPSEDNNVKIMESEKVSAIDCIKKEAYGLLYFPWDMFINSFKVIVSLYGNVPIYDLYYVKSFEALKQVEDIINKII